MNRRTEHLIRNANSRVIADRLRNALEAEADQIALAYTQDDLTLGMQLFLAEIEEIQEH